ncbi:hypothetical protein DFH09DRAFT_957421 [Mycena vulgaris]|nr:hypothetical protein DFH09DRAFT_957421 [Mycena vulgaris]
MDGGSLSQPEGIPQPSSIHILPYELLAAILVLARNHVELKRGSDSVDEVLVLCQVCAHWREVAHNTPPLWILDNFPITTEKEGRTRVSFTATEMFLARSAPPPISITFLVH